MEKITFTFHNVSIKSVKYGNQAATIVTFTFHNVSIKSTHGPYTIISNSDFTFHNVSIKSALSVHEISCDFSLYIPQCIY